MDKGRPIPLADLPAIVGRMVAYGEIGAQVDALIAMLDDMAGDPDLEDNGDHEGSNGDDQDVSWVEWQGRATPPMRPEWRHNEDDEEDDDDACLAGDDDPTRVGDPHDEDSDRENLTWECGERQGEILTNRQSDDTEDCGAKTHPARIIHRDRIRATRCVVTMAWGTPQYRLKRNRAPLPIRANDL
ncbi:hypothetical protein [Sphingomonas sp. Leaf10]|uniref:hypothetical protein n=1 Tax=Sphingomonas sp. Leaf10 TaxID=1735676 RepID=UPI0012E0D2E2|nr:hypothetical protein [Sphingomonas sp. Leaf10]